VSSSAARHEDVILYFVKNKATDMNRLVVVACLPAMILSRLASVAEVK